MELIYRNKLTWDDLAKIELPFFALFEVKKVLEEGYFIHLGFGLGISDRTSKAEKEKFLNDIERGELFLIYDAPLWHQPFVPILRYKYDGMYPLDGRCIMGQSMSSAFLEQLVKELYDTKFNNAAEAQAWWKTFADRRYPPLMAAKKEEELVPVSRKYFYQGLGTEGLHNQEWDEVSVPRWGEEGAFQTRNNFDPDHPAEFQKKIMTKIKAQGHLKEKVEEVMTTATEFKTKQNYKGDKFYSFDTVGKIGNGDKLKSKYMLDEGQFQQVKEKYYKDGRWDKEGVKNYLALPCFNRVNSLYKSTVLEGHTGVQSKLGLATEKTRYRKGDTIITKDKAMFGGGSQTTLDLDKMSEIKILW